MQGFYRAGSTEYAIRTSSKIDFESSILDIILVQFVQGFFVIVMHHIDNGLHQNLLALYRWITSVLALHITFATQSLQFV